MGVTYKLKDEVVHFIISQRQSNPLFSCRQLAESASQKFGLHLSKSSVHDVLKESGIVTPRGRKPKDKFQIPQEKKKQIQSSLSQVKLIAPPVVQEEQAKETSSVIVPPPPVGSEIMLIADIVESKNPSEGSPKAGFDPYPEPAKEQEELPAMPTTIFLPQKEVNEISAEYEGAGKIFLKAALWDLGIFSEENIKATDWDYYLTYSKGIKVILENDKDFFIDLPLPLERCIRETADGLVNNVKSLVVDKISDEVFFKACMEAQDGFRIKNISIVGQNDHILFELGDIMEFKRRFIIKNRVFMENREKDFKARSKAVFFSQAIDNNDIIDNIVNLRGFDTTNKDENIVSLLIDDSYNNKIVLQEASETLNGMYLRDEQDRLVKVKINSSEG